MERDLMLRFIMVERTHHRRHVAVVALVIGTAAACSAPPTTNEGHVGARRDAIIDGTLDTTHHAVVLPYCGEVGLCVCSGTLVRKDDLSGVGWIATAAHCLPEGLGSALRFYLQGDKTADFVKDKPAQVPPGTIRYPVIDFVRHPQFTGNTQLPSGTQLEDIAIVRVMGVGPDTPVIPLAPLVDGLEVDQAIVDVGYGSTGSAGDLNDIYGKSGTRRRSDVKVSALTENFVISNTNQSGGSINVGDSGGPTIAMIEGAEHVVGIHSTLNVLFGKSYSTRVSGKLGWVGDELAKAPNIDDCGSCIRNVTGGVRTCAATYRTCLDDADCNVYAHCMEDCGRKSNAGPTTACHDECALQTPAAAIALHDAAIACGCQTCAAKCGDTCTSAAGAPDASSSSHDDDDASPSPSGSDAAPEEATSTERGCSVGRGDGPSTLVLPIAFLASVVAAASRRRRRGRPVGGGP